MSATPCGCDDDAKWVCERHREDEALPGLLRHWTGLFSCPKCEAPISRDLGHVRTHIEQCAGNVSQG